VSSNPGRSKLAEIARLASHADAAERAGRHEDAVAFLEALIRLDPNDRRTLHRLGDLHRIRLGRQRDAAGYYAHAARCEEREGFEARALALWRLVVRCDPQQIEAHSRIGRLLVSLGRLADARAHYQKAAEHLEGGGRPADAAILRQRLADLADHVLVRPEPSAPAAPPAASAEDSVDDNAADLAADRFQNGRLFHNYRLHQQARTQLEHLLASLPSHIEGRRLLVEVCRALEDEAAASEHMRILTRQMRQQGVAPSPPGPAGAPEELPIEEWIGMEEESPADPIADLLDEIRDDVERVVDGLDRKAGRR
jgi:tetratricopeptide (TPR) repeat protein